MEDNDGAAAAGRVSFNVAATVRYPEPEVSPGLAKLRAEGEAAKELAMAELNVLIGDIAEALADKLDDRYAVDTIPDVGIELLPRDGTAGKLYRLDVKEGY